MTINELRQVNENFIGQTNLEKYRIIQQLLKEEDCFLKMSYETALQVLQDLGIEKEQCPEVYRQFVNTEEYQKQILDKQIKVI